MGVGIAAILAAGALATSPPPNPIQVENAQPGADPASWIQPAYTATSIAGYSSVAIGTDGLPLISYAGFHELQVAHCADLACTSATIITLKSCQCELFTSIAIGADGSFFLLSP